MRFEAIASTTTGSCILADASELDRVSPEDVAQGRLEALEASGRIFVYELGADGSCKIDLVVGLEVPEATRERSDQRVEGLLLRLPTGKLAACGVEQLARGPRRADAKPFDVPPGDYSLDAYLMPPEEDRPERGRDKAIGCGCMLSIAIALAGAVLIVHSSWIGWLLVATPAVFVALLTLWYNLSGERRRVEREETEGPPEIVVRLTRVAAPANDMRGGRITPRHLESRADRRARERRSAELQRASRTRR